MESAKTIAYQAVIMFILLAVGYALRKFNWLSENTTKQLSNVAISVINPIVIFNAYQTDFDPKLLSGLLIAFALSAVSHALLVLFANIVIKKEKKRAEVERFAIVYSNCAFMGIPLIESAFGSEGVFYLTGYITVFNIMLWTHGQISMRGQSGSALKSLLKALRSPAVLATAAGLVFFFTGFRLPAVVQQPLNYLGAMNTPIAMIVSGCAIAQAGLSRGFKNPRVYFVQSFKLIIVPIVLAAAFAPLALLGVQPLVINTVLLAAAAPTASATIMFAYKFGRDAEYAGGHFALSTLASVVTMPIILLASNFFIGICGKFAQQTVHCFVQNS